MLGCAALLCGCDGQDPERLARIGRLTFTKLESLAGDPNGKLANGWQAVLAPLGGTSLDSRVALRLRWDRSLAGSEIRVQTVGPGVVRLQGMVGDGAARSRAVEVAEATQGVETVENALIIQGPAAGQ
jgi:hypothetical protein